MPLLSTGLVLDTTELGKTLLLADTHVGYEFELIMRGVRVPRQTSRIAEHYVSLGQREHASSILIVGDVKHEIPVAIETAKEVQAFLTYLADYFENVVLVQGNHDGGLDKLVEKLGKSNIRVVDSRGILLTVSGSDRKVLALHGNAKPRPQDFLQTDFIVIGHTHPAVTLRDPIGYVAREAVLVRARVPKEHVFCRMYRRDELKNLQIDKSQLEGEVTLVILPCANPLVTGTDITRTLLQKSPTSKTILSYFELWNFVDRVEVYLQDFTYLGTLDFLLNIEQKIVLTRELVDWDFL